MLEGQYVCVLKRYLKTCCYYKLPITCCLVFIKIIGCFMIMKIFREPRILMRKLHSRTRNITSRNGNHQKLGVVIHKSLSNFWKCGNMTAGKRTYEKVKYHCVLFLILPSSLPPLSTGLLWH